MKKGRLAVVFALLLVTAMMIGSTALAANSLSQTLGVSSLTLSNAYSIAIQLDGQSRTLALSNRSQYKTISSYVDFERNPQKHKNEAVKFNGTVEQVVEGSNNSVVYRIAKDGDLDQMFYVNYVRQSGSPRFLEDDKVTVWGTFTELKTYSSTTNKSVTVPSLKADLITIQISNYSISSATSASDVSSTLTDVENRIKAIAPKDNSGNYKITSSSYTDYARNESRHSNEKVTFTGKVLQVVENSSYNILRVSVDNNSSNVVYIKYTPASNALRILEDDSVTVFGTYTGLYTYESTYGGNITIPYVQTSNVNLNNYTEASTSSTDSSGYHYLTKTNFEAYSRRPGAHTNEKIRFTGKVLQVIEETNSSQYRISVDSNSSYVIYVTISKSNQTTRALTNDTVTVYGTFSGIISYTSTTNVKISIPSCTATRIDVSGYTGNSASKTNGSYTVTKSNYESFARNESQYMNQSISFTAKVVQVVEGTYTNIYRMSIDSDSNCMFYVTLSKSKMSVRILEGDVLKAKGKFTGLYSYSSTRGGKITIPSCELSEYTINGYKEPATQKPNSAGYYTVTKSNYEDYARNESKHKGEKITFTGKIIQVVEGSSYNIYRIAVDSDSNCIFYVQYTPTKNSTRVLENDIVTLEGEYYGLYTYTTTLNSSITIPATIASSIKLGKTNSSSSSSSSNSGSSSGIGRVKIMAGTNIRASASSSSGVVGYIEYETILDYYAINSGWYYVKLANGTYGYVYQSRCTVVY